MTARVLVFDSGVGGLSVVGEMRARMPGLQIDYAADDAFRPYGSKSAEALRERLPRLVWELREATGAGLVVVACNTASVTALRGIRAALAVPVVGVVPAVKPAASATRTGAMAVLGTPATVRQDYVDELVSDFASDHEVLRVGSVALVDVAEGKLAGRAVDMEAVRREVEPILRARGIDTVVLACTHFPLLRTELETAMPGVRLIDSGAAIARRVESLLPGVANAASREDVALLVGREAGQARRQAFGAYGFGRVVPLLA